MATPENTRSPETDLVIHHVTSGEVTYLDFSSSAFVNGDPIPPRHAADQSNISPALAWQRGPDSTRSYAIITEDPDAPGASPFVHWIVYNLMPEATELEENVEDHPVLQKPMEAVQGMNDKGKLGYFGPLPPQGDPRHHYHFQLFALDTILPLHYGATRAALAEAMAGHVLAAGTLTGTYTR